LSFVVGFVNWNQVQFVKPVIIAKQKPLLPGVSGLLQEIHRSSKGALED
jgi:hypothetical protein